MTETIHWALGRKGWKVHAFREGEVASICRRAARKPGGHIFGADVTDKCALCARKAGR